MGEDLMVDFDPPTDWTPRESNITVIGVGGAGCNAVNYMFGQKVQGCRFIVCNTDSQALSQSQVPTKIQLGKGLGAGTNATKGRNSALDSQEEIERIVFSNPLDMIFVTAGMGGGTGTGASPVIAKMAKDKGILTVAVVTLPFEHEGSEALGRAIDGLNELKKNVDSLLIIKNENLYKCFGNNLIQDAMPKADEVLATAVKGIIEIIKKPGYVNVDFEDVKTVMKESGLALMGCGVGHGENRIKEAIDSAIKSPLLNDFVINSAQKVLLNITVAHNEHGMNMEELNTLTQEIWDALGKFTTFKRGILWNEDPDADDTIYITVIATGFEYNKMINITDVDLGNLIIIDNDFEYDRHSVRNSEEGISLSVGNSAVQTIGFSNSRTRNFNFREDEKPVLCISSDNRAELERIPAVRRRAKTEQEK